MEHKNQKKDQKNAESSKNNSIDDLFHMKDNDFSFWFHEYPPFYTIYEFTDIPFEELPKEVQTNVKQKKYVETEEELYAFLENYSS